MTNAARVWFILQYFGVKAVILNGGWPTLSAAAGLPEGAGPAKGPFHAWERDDDRVAGRKVGDVGSDVLDNAGAFMAANDRIG
jgi:3-mercaptopyruvate sulfurtransferase SseA